jgi:tungstate transport system substrate-binding protein
MIMKTLKLTPLFLFLTFLFSPVQAATDSSTSKQPIRMATTTSTENSGLLNYLLPEFKNDTGYEVHVIAVGTGKALRLGRDGDVDVVLVHAPGAEKDFVDHKYGVKRYPVMYNDFVIIGSPADPANLKNSTSINDAFKRIKDSKSLFVSRGDDSGTHKKEKKIWQSVNIDPKGDWYREAGQGMGKVIQMANELEAYTLTDRGTWLSYQNKVQMQIAYQGDSLLFNPYGIIAVNPERYSDINNKGAMVLINWITSKHGQDLIGKYKKFNQVLFTPNANTSSVVNN